MINKRYKIKMWIKGCGKGRVKEISDMRSVHVCRDRDKGVRGTVYGAYRSYIGIDKTFNEGS